MSKVIGILGGMGPLATVDLFKKIIENTSVFNEQEHLRIIIDNNPQIPSRIEAILKETCNPLTEMVNSAKTLENAGADFLVIPCHTAHYWLNELQQAVNIPIHSIIDSTTNFIRKNYPHLSGKILLLASAATVKLKMYEKAFDSIGFKIRTPKANHQKIISLAVQDAKVGLIESNPRLKSLNAMIEEYMKTGIFAVLGGCSEIPLLFPYISGKVEKLDPTLILAKKAIALSKNE